MLILNEDKENVRHYLYKQGNVFTGEMILQHISDDVCEIMWFNVFKTGQNLGPQMFKEMIKKLNYSTYYGDSRPRYYNFWNKCGARFDRALTKDDILEDKVSDFGEHYRFYIYVKKGEVLKNV